MKIKDIVVEAGEFKQGFKAVDRALKPSNYISKDAKSAYSKGFNAVDKILSPKKWFSSDKEAEPQSAAAPAMKSVDIRTAVENAAAGRVYQQDVQALKKIYSAVKSGAIKTNLDQAALLAAIKTAYQQQPLNDNQRALLSQFSKQF
jgi:hypothetical protein